MHFLILGATGPTGLVTVIEALKRNHKVTIYARNPAKLPDSITSNSSVTVIKGEFIDEASFDSSFNVPSAPPIDAVLSVAGPVIGHPGGNPITKAYETLFKLMRKNHVKRAIIISTASVSSPKDSWSIVRKLLVGAVWLIARAAREDIIATSQLVAPPSDAAKDIDVTLVRVAVLTDGPGGTLKAGYIGDGNVGWTLARQDIATFFLDEVQEPKWIGEMPYISS